MESFSREKRLLKKQEYEQVFQQSKKITMPAFFVLTALNQQNTARIGFALAKKSLPKASMRNRIKRVIRENFRKQVVNLSSVDIVVLAKPGLSKLTNHEIQLDLIKVWQTINKIYREV